MHPCLCDVLVGSNEGRNDGLVVGDGDGESVSFLSFFNRRLDELILPDAEDMMRNIPRKTLAWKGRMVT